MKIASVTLAGGNREDKIPRALTSVLDWVDLVVLIDTTEAEKAVAVGAELAGTKAVVRKLPDPTWLFSEWRNFGLDAAAEAGADWAIMLDTDVWIDLRGEDVRAALERTTVDTVAMWHSTGTYQKEIAIRLPRKGGYQAHCHELYMPADNRGIFGLARFCEKRRTAAEQKIKAAMVADAMRQQIAQEPRTARWHYYLGDAMSSLGRLSEAREAFDAAAALDGHPEETAWACCRGADTSGLLGDFSGALRRVGLGLSHFPGMPELLQIGAQACASTGDLVQAVHWARLAIAAGAMQGFGWSTERQGFQNPVAFYDGPYAVLDVALTGLGRVAEAAEARRLCQAAKLLREATFQAA